MSKWVSFLMLSALLVSLTLAVADDLTTGTKLLIPLRFNTPMGPRR